MRAFVSQPFCWEVLLTYALLHEQLGMTGLVSDHFESDGCRPDSVPLP